MNSSQTSEQCHAQSIGLTWAADKNPRSHSQSRSISASSSFSIMGSLTALLAAARCSRRRRSTVSMKLGEMEIRDPSPGCGDPALGDWRLSGGDAE